MSPCSDYTFRYAIFAQKMMFLTFRTDAGHASLAAYRRLKAMRLRPATRARDFMDYYAAH